MASTRPATGKRAVSARRSSIVRLPARVPDAKAASERLLRQLALGGDRRHRRHRAIGAGGLGSRRVLLRLLDVLGGALFLGHGGSSGGLMASLGRNGTRSRAGARRFQKTPPSSRDAAARHRGAAPLSGTCL